MAKIKSKKALIIIPLLIVVVIALSGCITDSQQGIKYEENGITFQYPDGWAKAQPTAEGAIAAIVLKNDSNTNIVVQQVPSSLGSNIQQAYTNNNNNLSKDTNYKVINQAQTTINGNTAYMNRYVTLASDGTQREHIACWMKMSDNKLYVILFTTTLDKYDDQKSSFDTVVNSFNVTKSTS